jgi:uncharacterized protein YbjQ (UPF0145 family)
MEGTFILVILGIVVGIFVSMAHSAARKRDVELQLEELRKRVLVVTSGNIPGRTITEVKGMVMGTSKKAASTDAGFRLAEKEAMVEMMDQALCLGANAITDLKITTGSYQQHGSQWMVSKVTCYGTAVRI